MADPQVRERRKEQIARAEQGYCLYPLVFINGSLASVGNAEYYQVLRLVQHYLKLTDQT